MAEVVSSETAAAEGIFGTDLGFAPKVEQPVIEQQQVQPPVQQQPIQQTTPVAEPAKTQPTTDPEIILEDEPQQSAAPVFDETKYLQENFGTTDKTVIKQYLEKYPQTQKELEEAALLLQQPKYKNKAAEVFDEILSKVGGDINSNRDLIKNTLDLLTTDENALDAVALVKFELKSNYPNLTAEQLNAHIAQTYKQGEEFTEEERNAGMVRLMQDSARAKTSLAELKAKALTTDTAKTEALQKLQEEKRKTEWQPRVQKVVEDFKAIKLNIGKIGGKNASINFEVPADVAKNYQDIVFNSMVNNGYIPSDESMDVAKQTLEALYIKDNLAHITQHVWNKAQSQSIQKEVQEYHNPSATGQQGAKEIAKESNPDLDLAKMLGLKV